MASTSGAHAHASQLESLGAEMAGYKRERAQVMARIEQLEQQEPTDESREELKRLQHKEQSLLDLITKLQEEKNLLLGSSAGAAEDSPGLGHVQGWHVYCGHHRRPGESSGGPEGGHPGKFWQARTPQGTLRHYVSPVFAQEHHQRGGRR